MMRHIASILLFLISTKAYSMNIVTVNNDPTNCLATKAAEIPLTKEGLKDAKKIAHDMRETLMPLMPAAGLAAPQIGVSKQIFIYSWNRSADTLEVVINPSFKPIGDDMIESWEACFSTMPEHGHTQAAFLKRYKKILATYTDLEGKIHHKILEDFAAKVFQHEYDHIQGIVNVRAKGAKSKSFANKAEMFEFMQQVKRKDSVNYVAPREEI